MFKASQDLAGPGPGLGTGHRLKNSDWTLMQISITLIGFFAHMHIFNSDLGLSRMFLDRMSAHFLKYLDFISQMKHISNIVY